MHVVIASKSPGSHNNFRGYQPLLPNERVTFRTKSHVQQQMDFDFHGPVREIVRTRASVGEMRGLVESLEHFNFEGRVDCEVSSRGYCHVLGHIALYKPALESALRDTLERIESVGRSISSRQGVTHFSVSFDSQIVEIVRSGR